MASAVVVVVASQHDRQSSSPERETGGLVVRCRVVVVVVVVVGWNDENKWRTIGWCECLPVDKDHDDEKEERLQNFWPLIRKQIYFSTDGSLR